MQVKELSVFENLITRDIPNLVLYDCKVTEEVRLHFTRKLNDLVDRAKHSINSNVVKADRKKEIRKYIRQQQLTLIALNGKLVKHVHPGKFVAAEVSPEPISLYHHVYKTLDDLLLFMEKNFSGFFDSDIWLPASYRRIALQDISFDIEKLEADLSKFSIDSQLLTIVFFVFRQFIDEKCVNEITWRKVRYLKLLKKELNKLVANAKEDEDVTEPLQFLLINLNFNHFSFFAYYVNLIALQYENSDTVSQQLEKLKQHLKRVNLVPDRPGIIFDTRARPIKEQIAACMGEDLGLRADQLPIEFSPEELRKLKIELDLSIDEFGCLLNGLYKGIRLIKNANLLEVFALAACVFRTKRKENISAESLRKKYYSIEHNVKMRVIRHLRAIADYLEKL